MDALLDRVEAMKRLQEDTESVDTTITQSTTISDELFEGKQGPFTILPAVLEDLEEEGKKADENIMLGPWTLRWVKFKIWLDKFGLR